MAFSSQFSQHSGKLPLQKKIEWHIWVEVKNTVTFLGMNSKKAIPNWLHFLILYSLYPDLFFPSPLPLHCPLPWRSFVQQQPTTTGRCCPDSPPQWPATSHQPPSSSLSSPTCRFCLVSLFNSSHRLTLYANCHDRRLATAACCWKAKPPPPSLSSLDVMEG